MDNAIDILLIEDNAYDAELTMRALRKDNIIRHILHLKDGAMALDYLFATGEYEGRNLENRPKLILLDLKMPKVSGIEVLEKLAGRSTLLKIPIVVLTSSKEDPDVLRSYQLGVNSYIVKPVDFNRFQEVVKALGIYWLHHNQPPI